MTRTVSYALLLTLLACTCVFGQAQEGIPVDVLPGTQVERLKEIEALAAAQADVADEGEVCGDHDPDAQLSDGVMKQIFVLGSFMGELEMLSKYPQVLRRLASHELTLIESFDPTRLWEPLTQADLGRLFECRDAAISAQASAKSRIERGLTQSLTNEPQITPSPTPQAGEIDERLTRVEILSDVFAEYDEARYHEFLSQETVSELVQVLRDVITLQRKELKLVAGFKGTDAASQERYATLLAAVDAASKRLIQ